jgi:hypothetical protein
MKVKLVVLVSLITVLGLGFTVASKLKPTPPQEPANNRLNWHVQKAKTEGRTQVEIAAPEVEYLGSDESENPKETMAAYTVLVAQPIETRTYEKNGNELISWTKFKTIEALSDIRPSRCPNCISLAPPPEMLPVLEGEFLLPQVGGNIVKDGVRIIQKRGDYPFYANGQKYFMLVSLEPSGVAFTAGGPTGVFKLDDQENLMPLNAESHSIKDEINRSYHNSLKTLRLKSKLNPAS